MLLVYLHRVCIAKDMMSKVVTRIKVPTFVKMPTEINDTFRYNHEEHHTIGASYM